MTILGILAHIWVRSACCSRRRCQRLTEPATTPFDHPVSVPSPSTVNNLTVTLDLTDQQSVANLSVTLVAPNGDQIILVENQINAAGTANHRSGPSRRQLHRSGPVSPRASRLCTGSMSGRSSTTTPPGTSSTRRPQGLMEIARRTISATSGPRARKTHFQLRQRIPWRISSLTRSVWATSMVRGSW